MFDNRDFSCELENMMKDNDEFLTLFNKQWPHYEI